MRVCILLVYITRCLCVVRSDGGGEDYGAAAEAPSASNIEGDILAVATAASGNDIDDHLLRLKVPSSLAGAVSAHAHTQQETLLSLLEDSAGAKETEDSVCLGQAVGLRHRLDEWYDAACRKYRCEPAAHGAANSYRIKMFACEPPSPPPTAIECRHYQLDGTNIKYPACCPRLRCIVSYHGKKFIQIVGQQGERLTHDAYKTDYSSETAQGNSTVTETKTRTEIESGSGTRLETETDETSIQIMKRGASKEQNHVKTLGPGSERDTYSRGAEDEDRTYSSGSVGTIGVADQMCVGSERRRRRYTPLRVWYDDACHKYRCEILNGKYHIAVFGCMKPEAPVNAIQCNEYNLDNENVMYPTCCPRLRCVVVIKGEMYIRISGQPEEEFPDVPLRTNQPDLFSSNDSRPLVAAASDIYTAAPIAYYEPKRGDAYYTEGGGVGAGVQRNSPEQPVPMLNMHLDWKHNVLTEFIHRGVIKALQYLKESFHG